MYFHFIFIFKDGVRIIWLCNHNRQTSIKPEEQDHTTAEYLVITECVRLVWYLNIYNYYEYLHIINCINIYTLNII